MFNCDVNALWIQMCYVILTVNNKIILDVFEHTTDESFAELSKTFLGA